MAMGSAPAVSYGISLDNLRNIIPNELNHLEELLSKANKTLDDLAWSIFKEEMIISDDDMPGGDELDDTIMSTLKKAYNAFTVATVVDGEGLTLELYYYDSENGDQYDNLEDGANWLVSGMTKLAPAGEKFKDIIEQKMWIQYG